MPAIEGNRMMNAPTPPYSIDRRGFLRVSSMSALGWWSSQALAGASKASVGNRRQPAMILLWLDGGPSQLETFDPQVGSTIGGPTKAIDTRVSGIQIADSLPRIAETLDSIALIRSMVSKEGDHERGRYLMKTGYRPDPTVHHPAIGAICAHHLPVGETRIPRYVSILSNDRNARGGYLGESFDPFQIGDPKNPVPDVTATVEKSRLERRLAGLDVVESAWASRARRLEEKTRHREQIQRGLVMMDSAQIRAFEVEDESASTLERYGDTPFGRGCLCARRLVEVGVRCVEVQLGGWDTHANNFSGHARLNQALDPAFAALLEDLNERDLLRSTLVVCAGEFGRSPEINGLDGRDHWANGFTVALAGGGIQGGRVLGATDPEGKKDPVDPVTVPQLFATFMKALDIDPTIEHDTPIGRPIRLSEGQAIGKLFA